MSETEKSNSNEFIFIALATVSVILGIVFTSLINVSKKPRRLIESLLGVGLLVIFYLAWSTVSTLLGADEKISQIVPLIFVATVGITFTGNWIYNSTY